eukprot:Protomagalhaensia_wolfi_Nauph_80__1732@NODE_2078_length_1222_cov_32_352494_g1623_i0_p1_GENE_NODE_2078_length_1222_cov_32_352494_g1623_i0NODE_2078_length_1222_cov_32_352494_g1623_i0_p1_ORF_typecomplete_len108_score1_71_NODE_2078_length_1222_cov_32_352494_g1623_i0662985
MQTVWGLVTQSRLVNLNLQSDQNVCLVLMLFHVQSGPVTYGGSPSLTGRSTSHVPARELLDSPSEGIPKPFIEPDPRCGWRLEMVDDLWKDLSIVVVSTLALRPSTN